MKGGGGGGNALESVLAQGSSPFPVITTNQAPVSEPFAPYGDSATQISQRLVKMQARTSLLVGNLTGNFLMKKVQTSAWLQLIEIYTL